MKVMVGAPVRNRGWIFPNHIEAILRQNVDMELRYILNNSTDNTEELLKEYRCGYISRDMDNVTDFRRGGYSFENLAILRNSLLDEFLNSDCDYLFSCDTDIIIPDGSIQQLIDDDKDVVSMLIRNSPFSYAYNFMLDLIPQKDGDDFFHPYVVPKLGVNRVGLTGAVYLIKKSVVEAGLRYGNHKQGEDGHFCIQARELGLELYCDTRLKPIHAYSQSDFLIAETE